MSARTGPARPNSTRPNSTRPNSTRPNPARANSARPPGARAPRLPFAVLVLTIIGGGVAALLALTTATAASEVRERSLDAANADLRAKQQQLARDVAAKQAPQELAREAIRLGLVPAGNPAYIRVNPDGSVTVLGSPAPVTPPPLPVTPPASTPKPTTSRPTTPARPATSSSTGRSSPTRPATKPTTRPTAKPTPSKPRSTPTTTVTLPGGPR